MTLTFWPWKQVRTFKGTLATFLSIRGFLDLSFLESGTDRQTQNKVRERERRDALMRPAAGRVARSSAYLLMQYRMGQKSKADNFCNNFVYCHPIFIIFGTYYRKFAYVCKIFIWHIDVDFLLISTGKLMEPLKALNSQRKETPKRSRAYRESRRRCPSLQPTAASIVSSPSWVRVRSPAANAFWWIFNCKKASDSSILKTILVYKMVMNW